MQTNLSRTMVYAHLKLIRIIPLLPRLLEVIGYLMVMNTTSMKKPRESMIKLVTSHGTSIRTQLKRKYIMVLDT